LYGKCGKHASHIAGPYKTTESGLGKMIITRSSVRISFGGGGTDMPTFFETYGGAVVSTAINKYFYTVFTPRSDNKVQLISSNFQSTLNLDYFYSMRLGEGFDIPCSVFKQYDVKCGFDLFMASEIPPGSGLGSSGAVTVNLVCLCSKLKELNLSTKQIAEDAYYIQREKLSLPIGKQDEYASAFGGLNFIEFESGEVRVTRLEIKPSVRHALEKNLMLFFTGKTRAASDILKHQDEGARVKQSRVIDAMLSVKNNAYCMRAAIESGDLDKFGILLHEAWTAKKQMNSNISNTHLDQIYDLARDNGAQGGKLTGAGGGGFFMFYCENGNRAKLREIMEKEGLREIDFCFEDNGVSIFNHNYFEPVEV
jgi:D-glycero-alpha-D-manno-heptose-7-phosphate kinase